MKHLTLLLFTFTCLSCSNKHASIYKPGSVHYFKTSISQNQQKSETKEMVLLVPKNNFKFPFNFFGQYVIEWKYDSFYTNKTLYTEDSNKVSLHPPRRKYMQFAQIPPFPSISLPPRIGNNSEISLKVVSGHGDLDGKTVKKVSEVTAQDTIEIMQAERPVWVIEGRNTNLIEEFGQYEVTYYFHETLGFVRWVYRKPDGEEVVMELVKVEEGKEDE